MAEIFNALFDDVHTFVEYMRANDSAELRRRLLVTDNLKLWYCRFVCCRESVFNGITPGLRWWDDGLYIRTVEKWLWEYKKGKSWEEISRGYDTVLTALPPAPGGIMSLEDEAKEVGEARDND